MADERARPAETGGTRTSAPAPTRRLTRTRTAPGPRARTAEIIATIIGTVTLLLVGVLAVHIVFVVFEANTGNGIVDAVRGWADALAWQFKDVFQPEDPKWAVTVNYGLAALVYLVIGRMIAALVRRAD